MKKILIVEDNANIRYELSEFLISHGYHALSPEVFEDVPGLCFSEKPDLILLDVNLQTADGYEICRIIRKINKIPIIFVTGRDTDQDEVYGIRIGGDDFIRKPYSLPVLLARIEKLITKANEPAEELTVSDAVLNIVTGCVEYHGKSIELSRNEVRILYYLFLHQGRVVKKDKLIEYLWENKLYVDENILNVNLSRIRKHLASIGLNDFIKTVPKEGYFV